MSIDKKCAKVQQAKVQYMYIDKKCAKVQQAKVQYMYIHIYMAKVIYDKSTSLALLPIALLHAIHAYAYV